MLQHTDTLPVLLDVGSNTGEIMEIYAKDCHEIVVLEPKQGVVEYGKKSRLQLKDIPIPTEYLDKVVATVSFHHFPIQDRGLEDMMVEVQGL